MFDVHPPLGRLIFFVFAILFGADYVTNFDNIGNVLPQWAVLLRIIPAIAGTILPIVIYLLIRNLNISKKLALFGALLVCIENSLIIQSRFLLTDIFLILFGFISLLLYTYYINNRWKWRNANYLLLLSIVFASLAFSIKWTGLAFIFIIFYLEIRRRGIRNSVRFSLALVTLSFFIYSFIFSVHFVLLPHSGSGDNFMSPKFQKSLINSRYYNDSNIESLNFWQKFSEVNGEMLRANTRLTKPHDYSSKWYSWPVMTRTVYYWNNDNDGTYLYLLGNPAIYYLGLMSVVYLIYFAIRNKIKTSDPIYIIVLGFLMNYVPFAFIGRVMFLYHYQVALVFSIIAIVMALNMLKHKSDKNKMIISVSILSFVLFIYFSPLTYGLPISKDTLESMMWIKSWR